MTLSILKYILLLLPAGTVYNIASKVKNSNMFYNFYLKVIILLKWKTGGCHLIKQYIGYSLPVRLLSDMRFVAYGAYSESF